jgi:hypothetical protein
VRAERHDLVSVDPQSREPPEGAPRVAKRRTWSTSRERRQLPLAHDKRHRLDVQGSAHPVTLRTPSGCPLQAD